LRKSWPAQNSNKREMKTPTNILVSAFAIVVLTSCAKETVVEGRLVIEAGVMDVAALQRSGSVGTNGLVAAQIQPGANDALVNGRPTLSILVGTNTLEIAEASRPVILKCLRPTGAEAIPVEFDPKGKSAIKARGSKEMIMQYAVRPLTTLNRFRFSCEKESDWAVRVIRIERIE
jgi:hypothetical protein